MLIDRAKSVFPRPFLKWAGGKSKLIQQYIPFFPQEFNTYYEPFLGGGAVFFHLLPPTAVLSDINPELINVYCCVRDDVESLIELLAQHQEKHNKDYYYWMRSQIYQLEFRLSHRRCDV
jgi:DNA adenine methylase